MPTKKTTTETEAGTDPKAAPAAKAKATKEKAAKEKAPETKPAEGLLKKAAEEVGSVLGTIAAHAGLGGKSAEKKARAVAGRLKKSGKSRLPRKLKKLNKKKALAAK